MAKTHQKSKKSKGTRKQQHRGPAKAQKSLFNYVNVGLAVVALMSALLVAWFLSAGKPSRPQMASRPAEDLDVWEWDTAQITQWIRRQGKHYKKFASICEAQNYTGANVLDLVEEDLKTLGVQKSNIRTKLLKLIKELRVLSGMEGVMTLVDAQRRDPNFQQEGPENPDNTNFGATDKPSFCRLNRWLQANGADLRKVYLDPEQRILRVRRKILKGETILTLPPNLFISTALSRTDSKIVQTLEKEMELGTHSLISIYMLEEMKNKESTYWQPYIDVIPERYEDIPIFWSDAEVKELQGDALSRYQRRRETLKNDYDQIVDHCPGFKDTATLEEFMWARTAVITRCFGIKVNGQKITSNLPIDFVMHANQPDTTWGYDQKRGCYHITAVRDIPKNKFLTITYGKKANARFLVNYGFCLPVNSRNKGFVEFDDANSYGRDDLPKYPERVEIEVSTTKVDEVLKRCRVIVKDDCKRKGVTDGWEVQKIAWEYLMGKCQDTLGHFPTTLAHDYEELKRDDINQNVRNALLARSGEKSVVDFYLRLATEALTKISTFQAEAGDAKADEFAKEMFAFPRTFTEQNLIVDKQHSTEC
jgi:hypothetical protein